MLLVVWLIAAFNAIAINGQTIRLADIPNPMLNPEKCGRKGVQRSAICDVHDNIDNESKDVIEGRINGITEIEYGVMVVSKMEASGYDTVDNDAEKYATTLHNLWGVGDKETQKGVLIFLSIGDRAIYISHGRGLSSKLSPRVLDSVIDNMKPYLKNKNYGKAIEFAILEIDHIANGTPNTRSRSTNDSSSSSELSEFFVIAVIVVAWAVVAGGIYLVDSREKTKMKELRRGQEALSKLMKEVKDMAIERYACTSCPICLEDFDKVDEASALSSATPNGTCDEESSRTVADVDPVASLRASVGGDDLAVQRQSSSGRKPMSLRCGHIVCYCCLEEYLKLPDSTKCPVCRKPLDTSDGDTDPSVPRPYAPRPPTNPNLEDEDATSCSSTQGGGQGLGQGGAQGRGYYHHGRSRYGGIDATPEILFRLGRMRHLYPSVMTPGLHDQLQHAAQNGATREFVEAARVRHDEITTTITDIEKRRKAAASGKSGSSRGGWGGGGSSGGRGGRW